MPFHWCNSETEMLFMVLPTLLIFFRRFRMWISGIFKDKCVSHLFKCDKCFGEPCCLIGTPVGSFISGVSHAKE